jgi:cation:H+ antiporter
VALIWLFLAFGFGLFIVVRGSAFVVKASVKLQEKTGLGEIAIGALFVSVATTLPEVFVSIIAVLGDDAEIAVGNAVGSMIFNMGAVVSVYLFARKQIVVRKAILGKTMFLFAMLTVVMLFSLNNRIGLAEGVCLLIFFVIFVVWNWKKEKRNPPPTGKSQQGMGESIGIGAGGMVVGVGAGGINVGDLRTGALQQGVGDCLRSGALQQGVGDCLRSGVPSKGGRYPQIILLFLIGQIMLVFGAYLLVAFGERIAHSLNIAEGTVAITFIAIGTGFPELFTALESIKEKHNGIALGNILGSCILNCTLLLGSSAVMSGLNGGLPISNGILYLSIPFMIILTIVAILPIIVTQKTKRPVGVLLIAIYVAYLCLLCL